MDYEISVSDDNKYIRIKVNKPMTHQLERATAKDVAACSQNTGIESFMFDLRGAPNIEGILPNYNFAYDDMQELPFSRSHKAAFLTDPDDDSHDIVETMMRNAGYIVKQFKHEDAALTWLLS
jgi:hypothetical protein